MPEFLYFDLGNVLLTFSNQRAHQQLAELIGVDPRHVAELMVADQEPDGLQWRFEAGAFSDDEFYKTFSDQFQVAADRAEFELAFSDMFAPIDSTFQLISRLHADGHRLGILSNTNAIHWRFLTAGQYPGLNELFELHVTSFAARSMKPDRLIYELAIEQAGVEAAKLFFVDDKPENVEGARRMGIDAVQYTGHQQLLRDLAERGIDVCD